MQKLANIQAQQSKERKQTIVGLLAAFLLILGLVFGFIRFYNAHIEQTLYAERLNQMREVTTQLFSGLEDVVKNSWRTVEEQSRALNQEQPQTWDELYAFMDNQAYLSDLNNIQCNIVAMDSTGAYYTQAGRQGLAPERRYLQNGTQRVNYVTNSLTTNESRMVFLQKLDNPIVVQDGTSFFTLTYYGISQNMEELNPYFECKAYSGNSSVYVMDDDGLKLFSSSSSSSSSSNDLLRGYNVLTTLSSMDYLHGSSFESTLATLETDGVAYSNAMLGTTELYYSLYKMNNSAWTLIFLVPSEYVATNTVALVNTTVQLVAVFAVVLIVLSVALITFMLRTQQKRALAAERRNSEELARLNVQLEQASKAKTDFLSNMSHDIRTPMNAIVGITKLMAHDKNDPEKMDSYVQKVQMSSQHLLSLINDVLDMSKIESSAVILNSEPIRLAEQIGQIESIIRPQVEERNQTLSVRVHRIRHEFLVGDAVRLRQIFINLLSNAVKYTPNGGSLALEVTECPCTAAGYANFSIAVTDNGYGMTPDFMQHVFEPFTRAENSTTNRVQGTGLGMAITKNIVTLMGGTITVQSEPNKGSRFEVALPFKIDTTPSLHFPYKNVLLITDEHDFVDNAHAAFSETDAEISIATTERQADALLRQGVFDIVLLGGKLQGDTLANNVGRLRQEAPDALLFFCCDYNEQAQLEHIAKAGGVDGVLARPLFLSNLANAIERLRSNTVHDAVPDGASVLKGMRFLCAEDNGLNAEILNALLDMNDATCDIYPNGKELVEMFAQVKPGDYDAILMDVQMPVMNGLEASQAIRRSENPLGKTIPIIAMTANAFSDDVQSCLNAGMNAHVAKPLDIAALERTIASVTGKRAQGGGRLFTDKKRL